MIIEFFPANAGSFRVNPLWMYNLIKLLGSIYKAKRFAASPTPFVTASSSFSLAEGNSHIFESTCLVLNTRTADVNELNTAFFIFCFCSYITVKFDSISEEYKYTSSLFRYYMSLFLALAHGLQ